MHRLALVLTAAACGSPPTPTATPTPAPAAPVLNGRAVADGPLTDPTAERVFALATAALADPQLTLPDDKGAQGRALSSWVTSRIQMIRELTDAAAQLPSSHKLFRAVVVGVAIDDFAVDLVTLPPPKSLPRGEHAVEAEKVFREILEEKAAPLAERARALLATCAELAPAASGALGGWTEHCRARIAALAELERRVAARGGSQPPPAPTPAVIKDCAGSEKWNPEPDALPPDLAVAPQLVVRYDGSRLNAADANKLVAAVTAKLRQDKAITIPFVPAKDLAASDALVATKKLTAKGPVCGQAPRFTQVLGNKHRNLVIAEVGTDCIVHMGGKPRTCHLSVGFKRAGSRDYANLPKAYEAPVAEDTPAAWIAAAPKLSTENDEMAMVGGLLGSMAVHKLHFSTHGFGDDDPWMRAGDTLSGDALTTRLAACVDAPGSFEVTLAVNPAGKTTRVELTPITAPPPSSKVATCLKAALEATAWPCTPDGKPATLTGKMCMAPK